MSDRSSLRSSSALYEPDRHESLIAVAWDEAAACAAIEAIALAARTDFSEQYLWPIHPLDRSPERPAGALKPLFNGAAGVVWGLQRLAAMGAIAPARDFRSVVAGLLARQHEDDIQLGREPSHAFPIGDTGLLMLAWIAEPSEAVALQLHGAIAAASSNSALGFVWGAAGALLAACFMYERTADERWRTQFNTIADLLWVHWQYEPELGGHHLQQTLYGHTDRQLCALHGLAGMVFALHRGEQLTSGLRSANERNGELVRRSYAVFKHTAVRVGAFANWPMLVGPSTRPTAAVRLLQHCIGAPGVITCLAGMPAGIDDDMDALLLGAGELVWHAGPTIKLPSLCHGAPGSGYAFLKLFKRTGDERWLVRARRFAMHGIAQAERAAHVYGQRKHSLWTGDIGLAIYLQDCLRAHAEVPLMDVF